MKITFEENINMEDAQLIGKHLSEYNKSKAGESDSKDLLITIRDEENNISGGLFGRTGWGWLHVEVIWLHEKHRGKGIGKDLMLRAEEEAVNRGCHSSFLDTFSFQAPAFYEKMGYKFFGELENMPQGSSRYFLKKSLK